MQALVCLTQDFQTQFSGRLGLYQTLILGCRISPLGGAQYF